MHYEEILPSPQLRYAIKCFWALRDDALNAPAETVLPDGNLEIIFNLADRFRRFHFGGEVETQPQSIIVGQMRKFVRIQPMGRIDLFGVRFQSTAAYHFFRVPLVDLTDRIVDVNVIDGMGDIEGRIHEAATTAERVATIEKAVWARSSVEKPGERTVERVKQEIHRSSGNLSISAASRDAGVSQRQLERYFKEMVGVSPKLYSRIVRLQSIVNAANRSNDLLDIALSHGYYDQSHFVREFTEFAGKSPQAFMRGENRLSDAFVGL